MRKNETQLKNTKKFISKAPCMSFPLVGNLSDKEGFWTSQNDRKRTSGCFFADGLLIKKTRIRNLQSPLRNEKGIALVMILILAAIALAIMAGLIYMVTSSSQISGMQKRYKTALEAGVGGADIAYQFISLRGDSTDTESLRYLLSTYINPVITTAGGVNGPGGCSGTDASGQTFYGFEAKLKTPSTSWSSACDPDNMSITPGTTTSYDMSFDLGSSLYPPTYRVYAKIASTVEGNSAVDRGLLGRGVVTSGSGSGEVTVMSVPYLYTVEMDAQNPANPSERAKLSILYQY